jgi:hypothetical protein
MMIPCYLDHMQYMYQHNSLFAFFDHLSSSSPVISSLLSLIVMIINNPSINPPLQVCIRNHSSNASNGSIFLHHCTGYLTPDRNHQITMINFPLPSTSLPFLSVPPCYVIFIHQMSLFVYYDKQLSYERNISNTQMQMAACWLLCYYHTQNVFFFFGSNACAYASLHATH